MSIDDVWDMSIAVAIYDYDDHDDMDVNEVAIRDMSTDEDIWMRHEQWWSYSLHAHISKYWEKNFSFNQHLSDQGGGAGVLWGPTIPCMTTVFGIFYYYRVKFLTSVICNCHPNGYASLLLTKKKKKKKKKKHGKKSNWPVVFLLISSILGGAVENVCP